jgi:cytoplasmic iron level regulating protein YaaA (DUF328/UPF0246 family)
VIVLLSPAKTLDFETPYPSVDQTTPRRLNDAAIVMETLSAYNANELAALMKLSESLSRQNAERNAHWSVRGHTNDQRTNDAGRGVSGPGAAAIGEARPAIFAFKGGVYQGFSAETASPDALDFANAHIRILSGLYGVLRPFDVILPYRLEMKTRIPTRHGANLYGFWGNRITETLNDDLAASGSNFILNLASHEYVNAVNTDRLEAPIITPVFKEERGDTYRVIGVKAKQQRGRMARYIADHKIDDPIRLKEYSDSGYEYRPDLSTEQELWFVDSGTI